MNTRFLSMLAIIFALCACSSSLPAVQNATDSYTLRAEADGRGGLYANSHGLGVDAGLSARVCVLHTPDDGPVTERYCHANNALTAGGYHLVADPKVRLLWVECQVAAKLWPLSAPCPTSAAALSTSAAPTSPVELWAE